MGTNQVVTFLEAMLLAVLQGVSELFPISSLGHTVLIPALLHWNIDEGSESFLAFVVVLHLGTALALVAFYRDEWTAIVSGLVRSIVRGRIGEAREERVAWLLVAGTIPVGVLGVLFQSSVKALFASPIPCAVFLFINGFVMLFGEMLRRRQIAAESANARPLERLPWRSGIGIGLAQGLALLPGISRSGASMTAGLLANLDHEDAAKYSFLLATPVILAASLLELPSLFAPDASVPAAEAFIGAVLAGVTAYASVAFLTRYFRHNDLRPFAYYCLVAGAIFIALFTAKVV